MDQLKEKSQIYFKFCILPAKIRKTSIGIIHEHFFFSFILPSAKIAVNFKITKKF